MTEYYKPISEQPQPTLVETLREMNEKLDKVGGKKEKKFRLPWGSKPGKKKVRDGWVIVQIWQDNKAVDFKKAQIIDGTYKLGDTYHTLTADDILLYKGRFPMVIQPKRKINPIDILASKHETRGQKYIIARMEGDKILSKKQIGWGMGIVGLGVVAVIAYYLITGGA